MGLAAAHPQGVDVQTAAIIGGSLLAAILAYAFQLFGGRVLGPEAFAPITVLWTVQFLCMQVLYQPLEHLVNRETSSGNAPAWRRAGIFGAVSGVITLVAVFVMREAFLLTPFHAVLGAVMVFGYAVFGYVRGRLAGSERFVAFGAVTAGEATLRLVLAVLLVWAYDATGLAVAMAVAPFVSAAYIGSVGTKGSTASYARTLTPLIAAAAFAQALLSIAPLVAGALGASAAVISVIFMTFAMYRGPLWVLQGLMARMMPVFVRQVDEGDTHGLRRMVLLLGGGAFVGAGLAYAVGAWAGPPVFTVLLGEAFRPDAVFSGLVAAGVILAAAGLLFNQMKLAMGALVTLTGSWLIGFIVAAVYVAVSTQPVDQAIGWAFVAGEFVALTGLVVSTAVRVQSEQVLSDVSMTVEAVSP